MNPFLKEYATDQDDQLLIAKATTGDRAALEALVKKHQPFIYNIAWKMVQMPDDAQDITQEVLVKVVTNLSKFRGESSFRTWLYRIVTNHFLQMKRHKRETFVDESFDVFSERLQSIPDHELTEMEQEELRVEIREMNLACMSGMLLCLTREQRLVYILGELFGADHKIGAEILDITKVNFRVRLSRARKDLWSFMNNQCGLVNKANPCRCHKKVKVAFTNGPLDSKNLLFNRKEYSNFQAYIAHDAEEALSMVEEKARELHQGFTFNNESDKKEFFDELINSEKVVSLFNLN